MRASPGIERLEACAALADGRVQAAEGDERAAAQLMRAVELFAVSAACHWRRHAPSSSSHARLPTSAPAAAAREGKLAIAAFERLGALPDADAAAALLRSLGDSDGRAWPRGARV